MRRDEPSGLVLLVEDNRSLSEMVGEYLESRGFGVDYAGDGVDGFRLATDNSYDAVILDLMLPRMDGLELCRRLRNESKKSTPVLMLTARDTLDDKGRGFGAGADDYLVKPFAGEELLWRCQALARRGELGRSPVLERGPLRIDRRSGEVSCRGQPLAVTGQAWRLLVALAEAWPRTVGRSELLLQLWADEPPESDALRSHLYTLRQALGEAAPLVKTVHGVGLRLDVPG
jgi:DNA-binding response OmpR family regulator